MLLLTAGCEPEKVPPPASVSEGCLTQGCHAAVENIHYGGTPLRCVDCHQGDPEATTKEAAHVTVDYSFNETTPGKHYLDSPAVADLNALPLDVIQFLNPADYRVAHRTCGSSILGGGNCHATITENSVLLNRATLAGTYAGGGFIAGISSKEDPPRFGIVAVLDPWVPETVPYGVLQKIDGLPAEVPAEVRDPLARAFFGVFEQLCVECHLNQDGPKVPGRYYSSGCNGCHMITADDARAQTADVTQDREELGHVEAHRFTNLIPDSQCAHCHTSHLGRSLLAQGVRERSEPEGDLHAGGPNRGIEDPENVVPWGQENYVKYQGMRWIYGKPYPYFIEDEDGQNDVDETPPDIHTEKGLACIDCHNIREAHGDRHMAARMDHELDVRCQSCHGRPGEEATLNSDDGLSFSRSGTSVSAFGENQNVFTTDPDGNITQLGRFSYLMHPVTQITQRTDPTFENHNSRTRMGCELHAGTAARRAALKKEVNAMAAADPDAVAQRFPGAPAGFTFGEMPDEEMDGRVECFTCHNQWTVNCYGCHIVRDDRETYVSRLTGELKHGRVQSYGLSVVADALALGFNARGRITPQVGTSIFFTHIDQDGNPVIDASPLTTGEGLTGEGNVHNPVHHHTIRRQPRDCDGCHPSETGSHRDAALLRAAGLGTGEFTFEDGAGRVHWLDRLLTADYDGDGQPEDPTVAGLPPHVASVERVVGTTHTRLDKASIGPEPGSLDVDAVNRMFQNRVVPQRPIEPPPPPEEP